jgi:hypothetical protein
MLYIIIKIRTPKYPIEEITEMQNNAIVANI